MMNPKPLPMKPLGSTGIFVSRLCFGTLTLGPLQANLPAEEAGGLLRYAHSLGVTFFDTAQLYDTYPHIRAGLRGLDAVICSKTYAYTREGTESAVEEARRETDRDVIDIFLLHEQEGHHTLEGHKPALDALYGAKAKGRIRAVGLSTHHAAGVYAAVSQKLDVVHPLYNMAGLGISDGTAADMGQAIQTAHEFGLGVFGMKALGGGHLRDKAAEALSFVLGHPGVDSVAVGMATRAEIESNAAFFANGVFPDIYQEVEKQPRRIRIDGDCEGCGACLEACRPGALAMRDGKAECDPARCRLCGYCAARCTGFYIKNL
jgi:aryl-alcohol dehydrogenase-like predicted oxidoreductase